MNTGLFHCENKNSRDVFYLFMNFVIKGLKNESKNMIDIVIS